MLICRYKNSPNSPTPSHVHDNPGYVVDGLRNLDLGWEVWVDGQCHHPELPATAGDNVVYPTIIFDLLRRSHA